MKWINLFHLYQPVHSDAHYIKEATDISYNRIIAALENNPDFKCTMNVNGCLFLRWEELGYQALIKRLGVLVKRKQVELTGNAAYHPVIPLIPEEETERQIKETEGILQKHFGAGFKPRGFFFSEMAYSPKAAKLVKRLGYEWIILDEISYNGKLKKVDFRKSFLDKSSGLKIIFRSRKLSNNYVPDMIVKLLDKANGEVVAITATDAELYGLRHHDETGKFEKLLEDKRLSTGSISGYLKAQSAHKPEAVEPVAASWETGEAEIRKNKPFALWCDTDKDIHVKLWQLASHAYRVVDKNQDDENSYWARWHLVRGLSSCTFWWASGRDFRHIFGPYAWNPDEIERGTNELIRSIRALQKDITREDKIKAEKLFIEIKKLVWEKHWTYYWKKK